MFYFITMTDYIKCLIVFSYWCFMLYFFIAGRRWNIFKAAATYSESIRAWNGGQERERTVNEDNFARDTILLKRFIVNSLQKSCLTSNSITEQPQSGSTVTTIHENCCSANVSEGNFSSASGSNQCENLALSYNSNTYNYFTSTSDDLKSNITTVHNDTK